jgi:hypothetical protein
MKCLRPLKHWDRGFESHSKHLSLPVSILCLCCVGSGLATGWCPVQGAVTTVYIVQETAVKRRFADALCSRGSNSNYMFLQSNMYVHFKWLDSTADDNYFYFFFLRLICFNMYSLCVFCLLVIIIRWGLVTCNCHPAFLSAELEAVCFVDKWTSRWNMFL